MRHRPSCVFAIVLSVSRITFDLYQAAEWKKVRHLRRDQAFDARLDIESAVSCVRGSDSVLHPRAVPCLCLTLSAVGMLTLALIHKLEWRLCPIQCMLFFELHQMCRGQDDYVLYFVDPELVFLD